MKKPAKSRKWTDERKEATSRMYAARRLWKRIPLFAIEEMKQQYPGYSEAQLKDDLRRRTPIKKMRGKFSWYQYGRYERIVELVKKYNETGDTIYGIVANKLRQKIAKPYSIILEKEDQVIEHTYPPSIRYRDVMEFLPKAMKCATWSEYDELEKKFLKSAFLR